MTREDFKKTVGTIPDTPGVYFFVGPKKQLLYIGKATSLRSRIRSYFAKDLGQTRGPLITEMITQARRIEWQPCDSVLEALILEANLIHTRQPRYNTLLKDDKSFNYVVITREAFPRILLVRGRNLEEEYPAPARLYLFGPFPHGAQLKEALKIVRKIFPYRDTCAPCEEKTGSCKPCFNRHLGLCPGVCSGDIDKAAYARIVRRIALLFSGKKKELLRQLERDMKRAAKEEQFEEAARLRRQVFALMHIQDVSLIKDEYRSPTAAVGTRSLRIEAYDVAHLRGAAAVGVMVVVEDGLAQKASYRLFHIRSAKSGDDVGALREILTRRLGHDEWPYPRLIVVDGAMAQIRAAQNVLEGVGVTIPVIGVVKDEKHRPREIRGIQGLVAKEYGDIRELSRHILLANSEAHRFAISHHRQKLRQRN